MHLWVVCIAHNPRYLMYKCVDCGLESKTNHSWYLSVDKSANRLMRCPTCGRQEDRRLWEYRYSHRSLDSSKENRIKNDIQYAKDLRESGLSPWINNRIIVGE
jgi:DNA-directed RNA polymerase subunit RPC12/RpoP